MTAPTKLFDIDNEITHTARHAAARYAGFADADDFRQEMHLYRLTAGKKHIEKWLRDGDYYRVRKALHGVVKRYGEEQKALASGYSYSDIAWYSPEKLADLVPLALDSQWDGLTGESGDGERRGKTDGREGGTLLAMIADVRSVLPPDVLPGDYDPLTEAGLERLRVLSERLGGESPSDAAPGYRRRAMSNSQAQARTREQE